MLSQETIKCFGAVQWWLHSTRSTFTLSFWGEAHWVSFLTSHGSNQLFAAVTVSSESVFSSEDWLVVSLPPAETLSSVFLKHYHTFMINAADCWRPEATRLQTLRTAGRLPAVCLLTPASSLSFSLSSPDSIHHTTSFIISFPSRLWFGALFLHQQHSENEAVSMVTYRATHGRRVVGALSQVLASIGANRGNEKQQSHHANEYWSARRGF